MWLGWSNLGSLGFVELFKEKLDLGLKHGLLLFKLSYMSFELLFVLSHFVNDFRHYRGLLDSAIVLKLCF